MTDTHQKIVAFITKNETQTEKGKKQFCILLREKLKIGDVSFGMIVTEKELDEAPEAYLASKIVQALKRMHEEVKKKEGQNEH